MMTSKSAQKAESKKSTFQLALGLTFLLVYATTTQMQSDSSEHAASVVQSHLSVGDAVADQEGFTAASPMKAASQLIGKNSSPKDSKNQKFGGVRRDFNQNESARVAASVELSGQVDADEIELQSGAFSEKMAASLNNMDSNIDAMITDMLSLQHQLAGASLSGTAKTPARSKNVALSEALAALIKQADQQKTAATTAGSFQSFASAEQTVIRLHAQASRLASIRD